LAKKKKKIYNVFKKPQNLVGTLYYFKRHSSVQSENSVIYYSPHLVPNRCDFSSSKRRYIKESLFFCPKNEFQWGSMWFWPIWH